MQQTPKCYKSSTNWLLIATSENTSLYVILKVKVTPWFACAGTEGWWRCRSNPYATLVLEGVGWSAIHFGCFTQGKIQYPLHGRLVDLRNSLNRHGKSFYHRDSIPWLFRPCQKLYWICYYGHHTKWNTNKISMCLEPKRSCQQEIFLKQSNCSVSW